jgi:hypothetical protein
MKSEKKYQFKKFDQQTRANLPNLQPLKLKKKTQFTTNLMLKDEIKKKLI